MFCFDISSKSVLNSLSLQNFINEYKLQITVAEFTVGARCSTRAYDGYCQNLLREIWSHRQLKSFQIYIFLKILLLSTSSPHQKIYVRLWKSCVRLAIYKNNLRGVKNVNIADLRWVWGIFKCETTNNWIIKNCCYSHRMTLSVSIKNRRRKFEHFVLSSVREFSVKFTTKHEEIF